MRKLVLMAAAFVAVSFASCGNKAANNTTEEASEATLTPTEIVAGNDSCANDSCTNDSCPNKVAAADAE